MSKANSTPLTAERLRELLSYDPETGLFTRIVSSRANRAKKGAIAGGESPYGYIILRVDGKKYPAHRLAFLYVNGRWPAFNIDHINGVRNDNRLCNIREATDAENCHNQRSAHRNNKSTGLLGVTFKKANKNFVAAISLNGKVIHIGSYPTAEVAHAAYLATKRKLHPFAGVNLSG